MDSSVFQETFWAMGTRFSLVIAEGGIGDGAAMAELARRVLRQQEHLLSRFDPTGPLAGMNAQAGGAAVHPPPSLWKVLLECREHWLRTRGYFDVTFPPLASFWEQTRRHGAKADPRALAAARSLVGFDQVELDEGRGTVRFPRPGMGVDLGGFGKGWALDILREELIRQGVGCALLSFGESSVSVIGRHPSGRPWPVGIADPDEAGGIVHEFALVDQAVSTSGNTAEGLHRGAVHIIDPSTGLPVDAHRIVSVKCAAAAEAEALSKALFILPEERWPEVLVRYPGAETFQWICPEDAANSPASGRTRPA